VASDRRGAAKSLIEPFAERSAIVSLVGFARVSAPFLVRRFIE
jgi:hypothetical protein